MMWPFYPLEAGAYGLMMIDPAWTFGVRSRKGEGRSPQSHYSCMSIDEISALPVRALAAPDCWVWLWLTAPLLRRGFHVLDAWGATFSTEGVWVKTTNDGTKPRIGTGFVLRGSHEPFLIARIGNPPKPKAFSSVIMAPRREHSRKPDAAYRRAEAAFGDVRRADLFSRERRPGWDAWGDQADKFRVAS